MSGLRNLAAGLLALAALAPSAMADLTVSGTVLYVDRAFTYGGGFTGSEPELPVRFARVRVLNANTSAVLATGATDENGQYALSVSGSGTQDLLVRVEARTFLFGSAARVTNGSNTLYSTSSPTFANWDLSQDLDAGTIVAQKVTAANRVGNPFNILDQMVSAMEWILDVGGSPLPQNVRAIWPGGSGSFASGSTFTMADDDGYDDMVQLHEFGHVVHNLYSDSDSPGGSHSFGQSDQDPRLSFGEGFATAFAGAVRLASGAFDVGFYMDCSGTGATGAGTIQLRMRMENGNPYSGSTRGEADEGAVFCALYDLFDTAATNDTSSGVDDDDVDGSFLFLGDLTGEELMWRSLDGPVQSAPNVTQRDMWNGLFSPGDPGFADELASLFDGWRQFVTLDADEPNNSFATAAPLPAIGSWSPLRNLYSPSPGTAAPGEGDRDFYLLTLTAGDQVDIETRYPGGVGDAGTYADPRLRVYRPDGSLFASDQDSGTGRNAALFDLVADVSGDWRIEIDSNDSYRKTGGYELRVTPPPTDCNGNGIEDATDIAEGTALDLDNNAIPDTCQPLSADTSSVSLVFLGSQTQTLTLDAGPTHAGKLYFMLGSVTGTTPGVPLGAETLPLVVDAYTNVLLANANQPPIPDGLGVLDGQGRATSHFSVIPGTPLASIGTVLHHAYLVFGPTLTIDLASNAIPVILVL